MPIILSTKGFDTTGGFNATGSTLTLNGIACPAYAFCPAVSGYYLVNATIYTVTGTTTENAIGIMFNGMVGWVPGDIISPAARGVNGSIVVYIPVGSNIQLGYYSSAPTTIGSAYFQAALIK